MKKRLKYGIIGCGGIAKNKHLPAIKKMGNVDVTAFCDILPERAEEVNRVYADGKGKVFTDYKMLLREELDAVLVLTPNNSHSEITVAALKSGKHVMCEKPMEEIMRKLKLCLLQEMQARNCLLFHIKTGTVPTVFI